MNKQQISVIIPAYNAEKTIEECIKSILNQTYKNLEIIIVDDGSTDGTLSICQKLEKTDDRIKLYSQLNSGVSAARNFGFSRSNGEYIAFVDSDDRIAFDMYEKMVKPFEDEQISLVCCKYYTCSSNFVENHTQNKEYEILSRNDAYGKIINDNCFGGYIWNKLYRKNLIEKNFNNDKIFDESIKMCEDFLFVCQYMKQAEKCIYLHMPLYYYIINDTSVTYNRKLNKAILTIIKAYDKIIEIYKQNAINYLNEVLYNYIKVNLNINYRVNSIKQANIEFILDKRKMNEILKSIKIPLHKRLYVYISLKFPILTSRIKEYIFNLISIRRKQ